MDVFAQALQILNESDRRRESEQTIYEAEMIVLLGVAWSIRLKFLRDEAEWARNYIPVVRRAIAAMDDFNRTYREVMKRLGLEEIEDDA